MMNFKYNEEVFKKEILDLEKIKEVKINTIDKKNEELIINLISENYNIIFCLDTSNNNNNFFKRNFEIKNYKTEKIKNEISEYINSYNFSLNDTLTNFFKNLIKKLNDYMQKYINYSSPEILNNTLLINLFSILLKIIIGLNYYNNENQRFNDFEEKKFLMEKIINLNIEEWYTYSKNKKNIFPLNYPPIFSYFSFFLGFFFKFFFNKTTHFENYIFTIIMKVFYLFFDVLIYHSSCFLFCKFYFLQRKKNILKFYILLFLLLVSPIFIIIDHGFFQYNNIMNGFFIFSIYFLFKDNIFIGITFYFLCFNFNFIGLYYLIPFSLFIIKFIFNYSNKNIFKILFYFFLIGIFIFLSFSIIYSPWIINDKIEDVVKVIYLENNTIDKNKIPNFWLFLSHFYNIKQFNYRKFSYFLNFFFSLLPIYSILFYKQLSFKILNFAFYIISFSFFLFSYNTNDKTVIILFLSYLLCFFKLSELLSSFILISMFSIQNSVENNNLLFPYFILMFMFYFISKFIQDIYLKSKLEKNNIFLNGENTKYYYFNLYEIIIIFTIIIFNICKIYIKEPFHSSEFYSIFHCCFCFSYFIFIFFYSNMKLFKIIFN